MHEARENSEKAIFGEAMELPAEERAAFLDDACGGNVMLRRRVDELLQAFAEAGEFLCEPSEIGAGRTSGRTETVAIGPPPEGIGAVIGRYKLLRELGEGGFGIVYEAEQLEPVHRTVALKVIRSGMDSKQAVARFELERQALALMDHPNIATVFDGGTTDSGRPYLVMEHVRGVPITDYCDAHSLSAPERLELFSAVCSAVQHAHAKGVIHRDLKPNNVLVTIRDHRPVPKVIDFGIAKATDHTLTERTYATEHRQLLGTPEYMSPEQAQMNGLDVDTRSDVYSLGVLLYELLTGSTPFDREKLRSVGYGEMQRIISEESPPRPSAKLSTLGQGAAEIARRRHCEPEALNRMVRGDLDWIVMKSLEKDRTRRYETASALVEDIRRFTNHEPVEASPPSASYRLRKFVKRNRAAVSAAAVVAMVLVAASAVSATFGVNANRARSELAKEARWRKTAEEFFLERVFGTLEPDIAGKTDISARAILDHAAGAVDRVDEPELEAVIRHDFGALYRSLGSYGKARDHLEAAMQIYETQLDPEHPEALETLRELALVRSELGETEQAKLDLQRVIDAQTEQVGGDDASIARSLEDLSTVLAAHGDLEGAIETNAAALEMFGRIYPPGEETSAYAGAIASRAKYLDKQGRYQDAADLYEEAIKIQLRQLGENHSRVATLRTLRGAVLGRLGRLREGIRLQELALKTRERILPDGHPSIGQSHNFIASNMLRDRRPGDAEPRARRSLEIYERVYDADHDHIAAALVLLGQCIIRQDEPTAERAAEALGYFDRALNIYERRDEPPEFDLIIARLQRVDALIELGELDEAEFDARDALKRCEAGTYSPRLAEKALNQLIRISEERGDATQIEMWTGRLETLYGDRSQVPDN